MGTDGVKTNIIGIGHKARQGKDTLGQMLVTELGHTGIQARLYSSAAPLKAIARIAHGMQGKDAMLLQKLGMMYREQHGDDVWINATLQQIEEDQPQVAIITDVRFKNEARAIQSRGGYLLRISRPGLVDPFRDPTHPSEVELDDWPWDYCLVNAGTLNDLRTAARVFINGSYLQWEQAI